jgi:hypothetical protein
VVEASYSFPSGQAMGSLVVYGMLAYFAVLTWTGRGKRGVSVGGAAVLVILIGFGRVRAALRLRRRGRASGGGRGHRPHSGRRWIRAGSRVAARPNFFGFAGRAIIANILDTLATCCSTFRRVWPVARSTCWGRQLQYGGLVILLGAL